MLLCTVCRIEHPETARYCMNCGSPLRQSVRNSQSIESALLVAEADRLRLEGVILTARAMAHRLNNSLALTLGALDLLDEAANLPHDLRSTVETAIEGLERTSRDLALFQQVIRIRTEETPMGPALDLERST